MFSGTSTKQPLLGMHKALYIYSLKAPFFLYTQDVLGEKLKSKATEHLPSEHRVEHLCPVSQLRSQTSQNTENSQVLNGMGFFFLFFFWLIPNVS